MINLGVEEMIKQWIMENIPDFNTKIHTEEDMKIKVLLPYLRSLGYVDEELRSDWNQKDKSLFRYRSNNQWKS